MAAPRERPERDDKRARILAAARAEFAASGYHATSIDSIIERADVARATFYAYFKGKRDVFEAALEELVAVVYRALPPIAASDGPVGPQVLRNIERVLTAMLDDVDLARILIMEGFGPDHESREKVRRFHDQLVRYAEETLRKGQEIGLVRDGDVRVLAAAILGTVKEVLYQFVSGLRSREELATYPRELLQTMLTGIASPALRQALDDDAARA